MEAEFDPTVSQILLKLILCVFPSSVFKVLPYTQSVFKK